MPRKERDEKRRDNKGRLLKSGESQRSDGRYAYKYIDTFGEPQFVYSWKLVPTDKVPAGKRPCLSLREKIKQIQKDLDDGIDTIGKKMTVCQLYEKYTRQRGNVRKGTQKSRQQLMKLLSEDKLGAASIDSVKLSDAKEWALRMQEKGVAYNTICNSKRSLKAIFYMAVQDDCLRKNPFDFQINEVINDDTVPKVPLTPTQENEILDFMQNDPVYAKYYDEVVILLETGLRISELCGLTPADLNFEKRFVNVDHQLLRSTEDGYYIEAPKTESGFRQVPMSAAAYEAFERVLKKRRDGRCIEVDGYKDFLFLNRDGLPKTAVNYDAMFKCLAKKYNKCHKEPLPDVMTPHTMRHTFCTRMANAGMNPKALQYIMGHANIVMTLNYYAHATFHSAQEEMERLPMRSPDQKMESAYDLWAMAQIAEIIGEKADSEQYRQRSVSLFEETWKKEFMNVTPAFEVMKNNGLYQGTRWQYRWAAPQYIDKMIEWVGQDSLRSQLTYFFDHHLYNQGNEPDIHVPYLFNRLGAPEKTQQIVRSLMTEPMIHKYGGNSEFKTPYLGKAFKNDPEGYSPEMDEDDGTMSAWYVFGAMGFYPLLVGDEYYDLTSPLFDRVLLRLANGNTLTIQTEGRKKKDAPIKSIHFNGKKIDDYRISHNELIKGGELIFNYK